jgi:hypothetical protein
MNYERCRLPVGGVAAEPPAWVVAAVGEDGSGAGLVGGALLVGFHPMIFEGSQQDLVYLHAIVTATVPDSDSPHCPVAKPHKQGRCQQPEQRVANLSFQLA